MRVAEPSSIIVEVERLQSKFAVLEGELAALRLRNSELNQRLDDLNITHDRVNQLERLLIEETEAGRRLNSALGWVATHAGNDLSARPEWASAVEALGRWADLHNGEF